MEKESLQESDLFISLKCWKNDKINEAPFRVSQTETLDELFCMLSKREAVFETDKVLIGDYKFFQKLKLDTFLGQHILWNPM